MSNFRNNRVEISLATAILKLTYIVVSLKVNAVLRSGRSLTALEDLDVQDKSYLGAQVKDIALHTDNAPG